MELAAIPLTLIAMVGALMLLAKAQKEALHDIFKYASYFILTLCVFTLSLVLIKAFDHRKEKHMIKMIENGMHHDMGGHGKMMMMHKNMGGPGCCPEMKEEGCCGPEGGMDCEKEVIIKDTIIKK